MTNEANKQHTGDNQETDRKQEGHSRNKQQTGERQTEDKNKKKRERERDEQQTHGTHRNQLETDAKHKNPTEIKHMLAYLFCPAQSPVCCNRTAFHCGSPVI